MEYVHPPTGSLGDEHCACQVNCAGNGTGSGYVSWASDLPVTPTCKLTIYEDMEYHQTTTGAPIVPMHMTHLDFWMLNLLNWRRILDQVFLEAMCWTTKLLTNPDNAEEERYGSQDHL